MTLGMRRPEDKTPDCGASKQADKLHPPPSSSGCSRRFAPLLITTIAKRDPAKKPSLDEEYIWIDAGKFPCTEYCLNSVP